MRYEGVTLARTSAALIAGLVIVASGCGRAPVALSPSPVSQVTPSSATESPAVTTPSTEPTVSTAPPPPTPVRPSTAPSTAPRPSPSVRPSPPPLVIGSLSFPTGEVGIGYPAIALTASGGTPPYSWSISVGSLPPPLAVSGSSISGTPNASGAFSFSVKATDSAGASAEVAKSATIVPALSVTGRCDASPCAVEQGCDTVCGGIGTQAGGLAPYQYTSGVLPPSTSLNGLSLASVFTQVGSFSFAVRVTDVLGATGAIKVAFNVYPQITLQGGTCSAKVGSGFGCQVRMPYGGGSGKPVNVAISSQTPVPKGTTATLQSGIVLFTVPAQTVAVNGKAVVILTDSAVCGPNAGQLCTATATVVISIN